MKIFNAFIAVITTFFGILLLSLSLKASTKGNNLFLKLQNTNDSTVFADKITGDFVIKFEGDSILLGNSERNTSYHKDEVSYLSHSSSLLSPFKLNILGDVATMPVMSGAEVTLLEKENGTDALTGVADSTGTVEIEDLPYGSYLISVISDDDNFLSPEDAIEFLHVYNDQMTILLDEHLFTPFSITAEYRPFPSGITEVEISWQIRSKQEVAPFRGYRFFLDLDGEYYDETEAFNYTITDLQPGEYLMELYAQSGFGTLTNKLLFPIIIEEVDLGIINGIDHISKDISAEWRYFDLNGLEIDSRNLTSGLYIRSNGTKREKIIVR